MSINNLNGHPLSHGVPLEESSAVVVNTKRSISTMGDSTENSVFCGKCKLPRRPTSAVVRPSEVQLEEPETEWLAQNDNICSMKMLSMLMLNAWRQRRNEVKALQEVLEDIKVENMHIKNQMHVYSTLVRVEQRRNDELSLQFKLSRESINRIRASCDSLTTSVLKLTADKEHLKTELQDFKDEFIAQESLLLKAKLAIFRSLCEQRDLQLALKQEVRAHEETKFNHEIELERIRHMNCLERRMRRSEEEYRHELEKREKVIRDLRCDIAVLRKKLREREVAEPEINSEPNLMSKVPRSPSKSTMNGEISALKVLLEEQAKVINSIIKAKSNENSMPFSYGNMLMNFAENLMKMVMYLLPASPSAEQLSEATKFLNFDKLIKCIQEQAKKGYQMTH